MFAGKAKVTRTRQLANFSRYSSCLAGVVMACGPELVGGRVDAATVNQNLHRLGSFYSIVPPRGPN
jgi:hypothetical protein